MIQFYIYRYKDTDIVVVVFITQSHLTLCDPMDCSVPGSSGFSRQESWSGLPFPSPGDLSNPGIEPRSPALQADALLSEPPGKLNCQDGFLGAGLLG